jgi:hypothetical protein
LRNFSFEIQPEASFNIPNLGERLAFLFFAPKIMTKRTLRAPTLRPTRFDVKTSAAARARPLISDHSHGALVEPLAAKHESKAVPLSSSRTARFARVETLSNVSGLAEETVLKPSQSQQRERSPIELCNARHYRRHCISTEQLPNGQWTAMVARLDGAPIVVDGSQHLTLTTDTYLAGFLAITDAEIKIDEIIDRGD